MTAHRYTCYEGVTRRGWFEPCDLPAVAVRIDPEGEGPYPVCKRHVRGEMVDLGDVAQMLIDRAWWAS